MSKFRNAGGYQRTRIDTRPASPEKAAGIRGIHRDTDGTVIGGVTRDGTPLGSKVRQGPADGSSLGNPVTVGLDRQAEMNAPGAAPRESFAATEARKRAAIGAAGGYGTGQKNLAGRKELHQEMLTVGQANITPDMKKTAASLGVSAPAWKRTTAAMPQAPAMLAAAPAKPPATPWRMTAQPKPAAAPVAAVTGKALAQRNIASMGTAGAIADYQKRSAESAKDREWQVAKANSTGGIAPAKASAPPPVPSIKLPSGAAIASTAKKAASSVTAQNFTAPPVANPQSVGASPPPAAPATPKPQPSWKQSPATSAAPVKSTPTVRIPGNTARPPQASMAQQSADAQERYKKNRKTSKAPSWTKGTGVGWALDKLSKPLL